jgi:hypothetical protein
MSKQLECIDEELAGWLHQQHVFFVATAPLAAQGHVNCSPKGGECFRVLGPLEAAYLDFTGSGAETAAHLRENGRIVLMFCAFAGRPNVVRLHGQGEVLIPSDSDFAPLAAHFPPNPGARAVVRVRVSRVSTSCGFSVPLMDFQEDRDVLDKWAAAKGADGLTEYRQAKNAQSIDGLPTVALFK